MPTTPRLHLPYPLLADPADVPLDLQRLAEGVEAGVLPPFVTNTPASPVNGQECMLLADAAAGVVWHLRYKSDAPGSFKWLVLGGSDLFNTVPAEQTMNASANVWHNLLTVGPSVTVPVAGDYDISWGLGISLTGNNVNGHWYFGVALGDTDPPEPIIRYAAGANTPGTDYNALSLSDRRLSVPAGSVLRLRYMWEGYDFLFPSRRWLRVRPIRVA